MVQQKPSFEVPRSEDTDKSAKKLGFSSRFALSFYMNHEEKARDIDLCSVFSLSHLHTFINACSSEVIGGNLRYFFNPASRWGR